MNHHTKQMVRDLRKRLAVTENMLREQLIENNQLRYEAERLSNEADYAQRAAEEASHQARQERERARRDAEEAESAAESRRWEQRRVTDELERARSWGDRHGVESAIERLKRL